MASASSVLLCYGFLRLLLVEHKHIFIVSEKIGDDIEPSANLIILL